MGRYLGIGIVTEVCTSKESAIKALSGEDAVKDFLYAAHQGENVRVPIARRIQGGAYRITNLKS